MVPVTISYDTITSKLAFFTSKLAFGYRTARGVEE